MVSNALSVGGFKLRSPEIRMNDGLLELLLVRDPKNAAEATAIIGAVLGRDFSSPYIKMCIRDRAAPRARAPWCTGRARHRKDGQFAYTQAAPGGAARALQPGL